MAKPKAAYTKRQGTVTSKAAARQEERVDLATADTDDEKVAAAGDQTLNDRSAPSGGGAGSAPVILGGLALLGGAAAAAGAGIVVVHPVDGGFQRQSGIETRATGIRQRRRFSLPRQFVNREKLRLEEGNLRQRLL